ncbi:hypothetical protein SAMD00019534_046540 [Acytostelium subglobosum LB1]|uniref:hypothetical protein n=1 Tax=Acytostelium subglobosum LB1 TaxID=1410327 RepID=UPI000644956C|nr:hypothetical protein SAMD00019534_046540 [Acytostelium subglobosum LB1]GAM21479.1 hypothetical protein SAMD00019534_046540 [Acytostelium subglobosum LB1]|eukprot:XP_012755598.1 hypothetical protein SAMD00019534_046540 [Acytostelium subglobosum LB1]
MSTDVYKKHFKDGFDLDTSSLPSPLPFIGLSKQILPNAILYEMPGERALLRTSLDLLFKQFRLTQSLKDTGASWKVWRVHITGISDKDMMPMRRRLLRRVANIHPTLNNMLDKSPLTRRPLAPGEGLLQWHFIGPKLCYVSLTTPAIQRYFDRMLSGYPGGASKDFMERLRAHIAKRQGVEVDSLESSAEELFKQRLPSRSYLKLFELEMRYPDFFAHMTEGKTVADLGASPGGWTYFALEHGCRVTSVDKADEYDPLVINFPSEQRQAIQGDAMEYKPTQPFDWLMVDMKVPPMTTLALLKKWLESGWCRRFVVTLKFEGDFMVTMETERYIRDQIAPLTSYINAHSPDHGGKEINLFGLLK